jgi:hypothetical protein
VQEAERFSIFHFSFFIFHFDHYGPGISYLAMTKRTCCDELGRDEIAGSELSPMGNENWKISCPLLLLPSAVCS